MAHTLLSWHFALLSHSLISTVSSASVHNHARFHNLHHRSLNARDVAIPTGWENVGCYTDNVNSRTLDDSYITNNTMTVQVCINYCTGLKYPYAGVEYGNECFCGRVLAASATTADSSECSMACAGNKDDKCGGNSRVMVYHDKTDQSSTQPPATNAGPPGWGFLGCYVDAPNSRTLPYGAATLGGAANMTVANCVQECQKQNYKYAGVEYGGECFCGNTLTDDSLAPDGMAGCTKVCNGNVTEYCGGANRLDAYGFDMMSITATTSKVTSTTSKATSTTTKTTTKTTSAAATSTAISGNWVYNGCYVDNANGRILSLQAASPDNTTVNTCIDSCRALNYTIAGLEYSTQCFCGNYLINGATLASSDTECNMKCGGNANQNCGAGNRMSIYASKKNMTSYPVPTVLKTGLPTNWTYQGCLQEKPNGRAFEHFINWPTNNSVTACLSKCAEFGFTAAGLQYSEQCFCGDDYDRTNNKLPYLSESTCSMACPGDPARLCGGPNAFTYYTSTNKPKWGQGVGDSAGSYDFLIGGLVVPLITQIGLNGKVVLTEKYGTGPANSSGAYELDVSQVSKGMDAAWREMHGLKTDVFCSAGLTLPDKSGRLLNIGGWSADSTFGVRLYAPDGSNGVKGKNDWQEDYTKVSLQAGRWYPSALQLVNGSILVIGGQIGSNGPPVPSIEILPKPAGGYLVELDWLRRTDPYNLYPFLTVLPSGNIAVFYYNEARIISDKTFATIRSLPNIPGSVENFNAGRTYPLEGTAMLLPQKAPYTDPLRVIICGGSTPYTGLALDNCVTISPEVANAKWEIERMPDKRVITCMTALPDGTYIILNGVHQGEAGFGLGQDPGHMAMLYDPAKPYNARFTRMANSTIDRMYHSEAILLLDGRVLVSGSDPEDNVHPQEYRVETFTPPYLKGNRAATRPKYTIDNNKTSYNYADTISITLSTSVTVGKISLMAAVASTHGNSMGQRTILPSFSCSGTKCTVKTPPNGNICGGPGWHMLFVLDSAGTPSVGQWVRIGGDPAKLGNWPNVPGFTLPGV